MTDPNKTPGQVAYEAWLDTLSMPRLRFQHLSDKEQMRWHTIANAVIRQVKSIIADEVAKVIHRSGNN